ncbi:RDD family protein [Flavobacterium sp. KACC 22761]|uniref:RDD family protein n=1 Tax=Flavobacterium sp. KACC 22761 TaxID=3092665 RepID=UPI002A76265A|nr:RDD family protein [Flavobacterium sp. KACC 22761]WPO80573.1 RDD family protein [Flavobacterium sp. KACC 22761]
MSNSGYILDDRLLASVGIRFLNYILDTIFVVAIFMGLCLFAGVLIGLFELTGLSQWMNELGDWGWNMVIFTIYFFYFLITEGLFGRSLAKFITGTVVVDEYGEKPDFGMIVRRSLCRFIPFDVFSYFGTRGWHDSISDTYVVNKKALAEEIKTFHEFNLIGNNEVI